jgi:hypothetical protein
MSPDVSLEYARISGYNQPARFFGWFAAEAAS